MTYRYITDGDVINGFRPSPEDSGAAIAESASSKQPIPRAAAPVVRAGRGGGTAIQSALPKVVDPRQPSSVSATEKEVFYPLYMEPKTGQLMVPFSDSIQPGLGGSPENPDAKIKLQLEAFHLPENRGDRRATVRISVSQDGAFVRGNDTLSWIVTSGLDLYKQAKGGESRRQPGDIKADLDKAFMGKAVSLPGGGGFIEISIYAHEKASPLEQIWNSIVSLFQSPAGIALGATVGFPALTLPAVQFFDGLIERVKQDTDVPIMRTKQLRCAFTARALDDMLLGSSNVFPVINQGFYVLAPAGHLDTIRDLQPKYLGGVGLLKPTKGDQSNLSNEQYLDAYGRGQYPFMNVPYAVISVRVQEANLMKEW